MHSPSRPPHLLTSSSHFVICVRKRCNIGPAVANSEFGMANSLMNSTQSLVEFLQQPQAFADSTTHVELVETHISYVFLTDEFVYKLKKPVRFEFLDFSKVELRHAACLSELRLNQRLSPDIYISVIPITSDGDGRLLFGGNGEPIDWVAKMKRLPAHRSLDQLLERKELTNSHVDLLAALLTDFYRQVPPASLNADEYLQRLEHHVRANFEELSSPKTNSDLWVVKRIRANQMRYLCLERESLANRIRDRRVVDGHGDLRPEHIYFIPAPKIIDCVEFSAEFRTNDIADELAFLGMECDRLHAEWIGHRILKMYSGNSGDHFPPGLIEFYKGYRACVRAKVSALRAAQVCESARRTLAESCHDYLNLADNYSKRLGPPLLFVVRGLSGTGKSTVAAALSEALGCDHLQTDVVRRELFGPASSADSRDFNAGRYTSANRHRVYEELFRRAREYLSQGTSLILDGSFLESDLRRQVLQIAAESWAIPLLIHCSCPADLALQRVHERHRSGTSASDIRPEMLDRQRLAEQSDDASWPVWTIDTSQSLAFSLPKLYNHLRAFVSNRSRYAPS